MSHIKINITIDPSESLRAGKSYGGEYQVSLTPEWVESLSPAQQRILADIKPWGKSRYANAGHIVSYQGATITEPTLEAVGEYLAVRAAQEETERRKRVDARVLDLEKFLGTWEAKSDQDKAGCLRNAEGRDAIHRELFSMSCYGVEWSDLREVAPDLVASYDDLVSTVMEEAPAIRERVEEAKRVKDAAAARRAAEEKAAKEAQKAAEIAERDAWIAEHGSTHLKDLVTEGFPCWETYRKERLAIDFPGWEWHRRVCGDTVDVRDPSATAIRALRAARKAHPDYDITIQRLVDGDHVSGCDCPCDEYGDRESIEPREVLETKFFGSYIVWTFAWQQVLVG